MGSDNVRNRMPQPPAAPPPGTRRGKKRHGESRRLEDFGLTACEALATALALVLCFGLAVRMIWIVQTKFVNVERDIYGFTFEDRKQWVANLPMSEKELSVAREARSGVVTALFLEEDRIEPSIRFQSAAVKTVSLGAPVREFAEHSILGIPGPFSKIKKDINQLKRVNAPQRIVKCKFENDHYNWQTEGACAIFLKDDVNDDVESFFKLLAQKHGQPAIFKWWPHVWGSDESEHHTFMQSVVPALPSLSLVKSHHPVYLL